MKFFVDSERKFGLYVTVIFHLIVLIILLLAQVHRQMKIAQSFVIDFSKAEEMEKKLKEEELKAQVAKDLEKMLATATSSNIVENQIDTRNEELKDDRETDAEELYKEAERLERELKSQDNFEDIAAKEEKQEKEYKAIESKRVKGPAVLSWHLENRNATYLPIPSYKAYTGGIVKVKIIVNNKGQVIKAKVVESESSADPSLHTYALEAALRARFSLSSSAPSKQEGDIIYTFVAQ